MIPAFQIRESKRTSAEQSEEEAARMPPEASKPACRERTGCTRPKGDSLLPLRKPVCNAQTGFYFLILIIHVTYKGVEGTVPRGTEINFQ